MANAKRKCKYKPCGKYQAQETMIKVPLGRFCDFDCVNGFRLWRKDIEVKKNTAKIKKDKIVKKRDQRSNDKERLEQLYSRSKWYKRLERLVNQWVLYRDRGKACCTCDEAEPSVVYHAGHFQSVGSRQDTRFILSNIHKQCQSCNTFNSGRRPEYNEFIKIKYGEDWYRWLVGPQPSLKKVFPTYQDIKDEIERYRILLVSVGIKPNLRWK